MRTCAWRCHAHDHFMTICIQGTQPPHTTHQSQILSSGSPTKNIQQKVDPFQDPINQFLCQFLLALLTLGRVSEYPWHRETSILLKALLSPGMNHQICLANARYVLDSYRGIIQRFILSKPSQSCPFLPAGMDSNPHFQSLWHLGKCHPGICHPDKKKRASVTRASWHPD